MKYRYLREEFRDLANGEFVNPESWLRFSIKTVVFDRTTETHRLELPKPLPGAYLKIYRYPKFKDKMRIFFRGGFAGRSRAKVEFDNIMLLNSRGLAPRVIAFASQRKLGILHYDLLVLEEVRDCRVLDEYIAAELAGFDNSRRNKFISELALFTRKMNDGGFLNGQYHWRNILVTPEPDGFRFQIIDPSSSRLRHKLFKPYFDLATLDICANFFFTRCQRLRFLKIYLGRDGKLTSKHKRLVRKITACSNSMAGELKRYRKILPC